jgi:2-polyprenyl-6-methoxyphenol hydroxylase-like FAD-dependent oxidoreductase
MNVLVVGAGPVGLAMACELVRHGVNCRLIDKSPSPSPLSKALAIQPRTLEIFERMGVVQTFLEQGLKVLGLNAWMGGEKHAVHLRFEGLDSPYPFVIDMPQSKTEAILTDRLTELGLQVERGTELIGFSQTAEGVAVSLRHADGREEALNVGWLVGCDGAHSTVRHQLGATFEGSAYPESFVLADVHVSWALPDNEIHVFLHEEGILAAFPYGSGRYRLMADVAHSHPDGKVEEPTLEEFQRLVDERGPAKARISDPVWLAGFRTHLRHAHETRYGRVFLAGDAAHIHSPAGGQGMNTGIQDAFNLAWKLALVAKGKACDTLLDTYPQERQPVAESVMKMSDGMLRMATIHHPLPQKMRNLLAPMLVNNEMIQQRVRNQISEVAIHYRHSPIVREHRAGLLQALKPHRLHAGDRLPDVGGMIGPDGVGERRLYELLRGTRHTLLVLSDSPGNSEVALDALGTWADELEVLYIARETGGLAQAVVDPEQALLKRFDVESGGMILVRPDGYIGCIGDTVDLTLLRSYFEKLSAG